MSKSLLRPLKDAENLGPLGYRIRQYEIAIQDQVGQVNDAAAAAASCGAYNVGTISDYLIGAAKHAETAVRLAREHKALVRASKHQ